MSVYFLKAQDLIKIGYSADPNRRTQSIISTFGHGEVLAIIPGGRELEAFLHSRFAAHHSYGEWFEPHEDLLTFIASLNAPTSAEPDDQDERTLLELYDETHAGHCADCLNAALRKTGLSQDEFFEPLAQRWGISVKRWQEILSGKTNSVSSGEYTLCRALGQSVGFDPDMRMDGRISKRTAENWQDSLQAVGLWPQQ